MEVKCSLCGKKEKISEWHKDYEKVEKNMPFTYICEVCSSRLKREALEGQKPLKPL